MPVGIDFYLFRFLMDGRFPVGFRGGGIQFPTAIDGGRRGGGWFQGLWGFDGSGAEEQQNAAAR